MRSYPSVNRALAETLIDVIRFIEGTDEEQMNEDDAVKVLELAAASLSSLTTDQRTDLLELLATMAAEESSPARRQFIADFPEAFGLIHEPADQ